MEVNQFLVALSYGDAISNEALALQAILREKGFRSRIYAEFVDSRLLKHFNKYSDYDGDPDNICIFHFSIGSALLDHVKALPDRKVMIYHNLTPADYFRDYNDLLYQQLKVGREELVSFVDQVELALGDSTYNAQELEELGFDPVAVQPIVLKPQPHNQRTDAALEHQLKDGKTNVLFVGRIAPNKCQEDVIKAFALYQRFYNPQSRLLLVGKYEGMESYYGRLQSLVQQLGVQDVRFTGLVSDEALHTYYKSADLYVSMSEHEGFLVPLLECAHYQLPILAFDSGAIGETLNGSGIKLAEKNHEQTASLIHRLSEDSALRQRVVEGQQAILERFSYARTRAVFEHHLEQLI